jgi:hypothetical protein
MDILTLYSKIAAVPASIRQWLGSVEMTEKNEALEKQFNLPTGSAGTIAKLIQRLQIKDLAPENFSGQLALELNLEKNKALLIVDEIKKAVLLPIQKELENYGVDVTLLDKFNPAVPKPAAGPMIISDDKPTLAATALAQPQEPQPPAPAPLPEKGWSTMRVSDVAPKNQPMAPTTFPAPTKVPVGMPTAIGASAPVMPPAPKPAPMPMMMVQGGNVPKPIKTAPDFSIVHQNTENIMSRGGVAPSPLKPAVFEGGGLPARVPMPLAKDRVSNAAGTEARIPASAGMTENARVVHYSDLRSSLPAQLPSVSKAPVAEAGRHVVEMTAESSAPKAMPMGSAATPKPAFETITAKPGMAAMPIPKPPAPPMRAAAPSMPTAPAPSTPAMPVAQKPFAPMVVSKPAMMPTAAASPAAMPVPIPKPPTPQKPGVTSQVPMPPKPTNPQISAITPSQPLPTKPIIVDFK